MKDILRKAFTTPTPAAVIIVVAGIFVALLSSDFAPTPTGNTPAQVGRIAPWSIDEARDVLSRQFRESRINSEQVLILDDHTVVLDNDHKSLDIICVDADWRQSSILALHTLLESDRRQLTPADLAGLSAAIGAALTVSGMPFTHFVSSTDHSVTASSKQLRERQLLSLEIWRQPLANRADASPDSD